MRGLDTNRFEERGDDVVPDDEARLGLMSKDSADVGDELEVACRVRARSPPGRC